MDKERVWIDHVHNKCFQVQRDLDEIRKLFRELMPEWCVHDRLCVFDRQLAVMDSEARRLISDVTRIDSRRFLGSPPTPRDNL